MLACTCTWFVHVDLRCCLCAYMDGIWMLACTYMWILCTCTCSAYSTALSVCIHMPMHASVYMCMVYMCSAYITSSMYMLPSLCIYMVCCSVVSMHVSMSGECSSVLHLVSRATLEMKNKPTYMCTTYPYKYSVAVTALSYLNSVVTVYI